MSTVSIENVRKVYDGDSGTVAVDDISFEITDAKLPTIVGPSESGKSMLLHMIAGLEDITEGTIRTGGRVVNGIQPQGRDVVMVFQSYMLYPHMTARKNMSYGLQLTTGLPGDGVNRRMMDATGVMGVMDQLGKYPRNLSGGRQQRIATGRAIVRELPVFLFDEPLSNFDIKLRLHMWTELRQLQDALRMAAVYVTHNQEEAMVIPDRVAVVNGGELQQIGTPEEIYNEPRNPFMGDFVRNPSMNQSGVRLSGTSLVANGFSYDLSGRVLEHIRQYADGVDGFVLGIWPENISLTDSDEPNAVRVFLDVRESVGSDNYLHFDIEGEECWARVPGDVKPDTNQKLSLALDKERLHLFRQPDGTNVLAQEEPPSEVTVGQNT